MTDEGILVDNVAVHPSHPRDRLGRALLEFAEAEARRAGFDSIYLYTHEKMTENLAIYARIGYVEYDRHSQGAFSLVYLRNRRVADAIEALEFLGRHLRTDKVVLLAESMGTLTEVPLVKRRQTDRWIWAWNANMAWAFRATCLRRTWTAGSPSGAWRSALPQRQGGQVGGC